jgi:hypothetical protein
MVFDVDFDALVWRLLPVRLRGAKMYAWLKVLVVPMRYVYGLFMANRQANLYRLAHNGQVCKMEAVLNDAFDPDDKRIFISDGPFKDPIYIYRRAEQKPVALYTAGEHLPNYLYTRDETAAMGIQFYVNVPTAVTLTGGYSAIRLKSLVNKYRLPGITNYAIIIF